jgi:hypothetical protein
MSKTIGTRLYLHAALVLALVLAAAPARAQYQPRPIESPAVGEAYHVEGALGFWMPNANMTISSEQFNIIGSTIDFTKDLGLQDQHFPEFHLVGRPGKRHKLRFQYIPINYQQSTTLKRTIIFNGQRYDIGVPVNSTLDWRAYRFGYEFDFISRDRGYGGFIVDFKYTNVTATLTSPIVSEYTHAKAPIPAFGGIFRVYPISHLGVTGEVTVFQMPDNLVRDSSGHYTDIDFYGTYNFTNNVGVQAGYRSFDVGYLVDTDLGNFVLRGFYLGFVARY